MHALDRRLDAVFSAYDDLVRVLGADDLQKRLPVPSNRIGSQLWCVLGARETWGRAITSGTWGPFACSVTTQADTFRQEVMARALTASAVAFRRAVADAPRDDTRVDLTLGLLEHEVQHLGQLIRYLLGLGIDPPPSWRERFAL